MDEWSFIFLILTSKANGPVSKVIPTLCMRQTREDLFMFF
jgi:hypothetical protein